MAKNNISTILEKFINSESIFINKKVFQISYNPDTVLHRDEQLNTIAGILAPCLRMEKPSNLFLYGKTGTGKTLTIKNTTDEILSLAEKNNIPVKVVYVNCKLKKIADTEYRLVAQIIREFGKEVAATGLPTDEVYKIFFQALDEKEQLVILILDEIDQLVKKIGDEILYNLTRINTDLKKSQISLIGISNDLVFTDTIDPRVRSSLSEEELVFPPYNAIQLQHILKARAKAGFKEEALAIGVIEKCAAYAAREHGDARRALELLRVAGELAEREGKNKVMIKHIDLAEEKIEKDRVMDIVFTQPKQHQATLYSIFLIKKEKPKERLFTGDIYEIYKNICKKSGLRPLTQRRLSDIVAELDMLGIINAKVISKGRYGRTREITIATNDHLQIRLIKVLEDGLNLS